MKIQSWLCVVSLGCAALGCGHHSELDDTNDGSAAPTGDRARADGSSQNSADAVARGALPLRAAPRASATCSVCSAAVA
jgi:hypothetical protein